MAQENKCPQCGAQMPPDAPEGLCPKCLMKAVRVSNGDATLDDSGLIEGPGTKIGRYELLSLIGEGGMGLVYQAEQKEPVKRRVALKIIKPGMDSAQVIARFEAERQALALLDHPNIAHVFDAGTTETGRPYFVMEYVKGMSVTMYCDDRKLNIEQRLKLFKEVCEGIHHAHQKGIIHRDIKPSNILVSMHGDRAVPKIIDFGIAKATARSLTDKTVFTCQGQLLGTPEYMSPEQVDLATQDIDTRSDIYSLGVLLYELLAGVLPFEEKLLRSGGLAEIQRTIREQEPASPSIRLTNLGEQAKTIATSRGTQAIALARRLHRELEWIPLKAMRKDRCRRYRSASEMADDIQNYLNGRPLIAGPETAVYRAKKFVHKHAGSVVTAALVAVAIILGLIVSTAMYLRAEQARRNESAARTKAEKAEDVAQQQRDNATKALGEKEKAINETEKALYVNRINLADKYYEENNIGRVHELLLKDYPSELRGWEWDYLWRSSNQARMTLRGHQYWIPSVAFSRDGKLIASGSEDRTIKVWDANSGRELRTFKHNTIVLSVAFNPDSKRIVSCGSTIKIWDTESDTEPKTLKKGNEGYFYSVAFSPDGKWIVSGSWDRKVKVWDANNGSELRTLSGHGGIVYSVSFSPDGKRIVSGSWDRTVKVWDVNSGAEVRTLRGHHDCVRSVAFSPDGRQIVSGGYDKIRVWDAESGDNLLTIRGHETGTLSVAFSPDGRRIVSGGRDQVVKVWDANDGKELTTFRGHKNQVASVAFSRDGTRIVSSSDTIKVWDADDNAETTMTLRGHRSSVYSVVFSPDSKWIVSGSSDRTLKVWDVNNGAEVRTLLGHQDCVRSVAFSHNGRRIVSGGYDKIRVWDAINFKELLTIRGHETGTLSVAFSPDGRRIVSGGRDQVAKVWNANNGSELMTLRGHDDQVASVAFSPDGKRIVTGSSDRTVKVWDANNGSELRTLSGHGGIVYSVSFSPDGKRIVSGSWDRTVKVWDVNSGAEVRTLRGHHESAYSVAFSPDGKRIVSGSIDDTLKVWDVESGAELVTLREHEHDVLSAAFRPDMGDVFSVAFSPDSRRIVSGINNRELKVWDIPDPEEITTEIQAEEQGVSWINRRPDH